MVLMIVAILVLAAGLILLSLAWQQRRNTREQLNASDQVLKLANDMHRHSADSFAKAKEERELAGAIMAYVRRIEDSLTRPRFALNKKTGRIRALRHDEQIDLIEEIETGDPDPNCKACYGRGWDGRRRETGMVVPCNCVKRRVA